MLSSEDVAMSVKINKKIKVIIGNLNLNTNMPSKDKGSKNTTQETIEESFK